MEQKEAVCPDCGKPIWMVRNLAQDRYNGKWVPCDMELRRFEPVSSGGTFYMTGNGVPVRGVRSVKGNTYGYRMHGNDGKEYCGKDRDEHDGTNGNE